MKGTNMLRFCYNVARLFVILVGFSTFTAGSIYVAGRYIQEQCKPVYVSASSAKYFYFKGLPSCDYMQGAVELVRDRGLTIEFIEALPYGVIEDELPCICFFDKNGNEIVESRMTGIWNLYDMNIRFGITPAE